MNRADYLKIYDSKFMTQPMQPLCIDEHGVVRFKANLIVRFLLDTSPFNLNQIAAMPFSREDREQLAQLIGYSVSGFSELSYATDVTLAAAESARDVLMGGDLNEPR